MNGTVARRMNFNINKNRLNRHKMHRIKGMRNISLICTHRYDLTTAGREYIGPY
jgi:hypothetical protein